MKLKLKYLLPLAFLLACISFSACGKALKAPEQLSPPAGLQINNDVLFWEPVEKAESYAVYVDGREFLTTECNFDLAWANQSQIHKIEVLAYNDSGDYDSEATEILFVGKDAPATNGLEFQTSGNNVSVTRYASDENGVCVIPEVYDGVKVTGLTQKPSVTEAEKIKILYLPSGLRDSTLGAGVMLHFSPFTNLESVYIREGNERFVSLGNSIIDKQENKVVLGGTKSIIPDSVTKIGAYAYSRRSFKTFTVPDQIIEIGSFAFSDCARLEKVVLPERMQGATLLGTFARCISLREVNIPEGVIALQGTFRECSSLTEIAIPSSVEELNGYAFSYCESLKKIILPESVRAIDKEAFAGCSALQSVNIPVSLQALQYSFAECTSLESVVIPGNVKTLTGTFMGCTSLKKAILEEGVEALTCYQSLYYEISFGGEKSYSRISTFQDCISLTDIVLPSTLKTIGQYTFEECTALEMVFYAGTEEEWAENVKVVETGNEAFLSATRYYYSETPPKEDGNYWHYADGVPTVWSYGI